MPPIWAIWYQTMIIDRTEQEISNLNTTNPSISRYKNQSWHDQFLKRDKLSWLYRKVDWPNYPIPYAGYCIIGSNLDLDHPSVSYPMRPLQSKLLFLLPTPRRSHCHQWRWSSDPSQWRWRNSILVFYPRPPTPSLPTRIVVIFSSEVGIDSGSKNLWKWRRTSRYEYKSSDELEYIWVLRNEKEATSEGCFGLQASEGGAFETW